MGFSLFKLINFVNNKGQGVIVVFTLIIKTTFIYCAMLVIIRIMGKREIGQLSPFDLVIAIMIAELAIFPIENEELGIIEGLVPIIVLAFLEILLSILSLKSIFIRSLVSGRPAILIKNGEILYKTLKRTKYNVNDLLHQLRMKDIFDIDDVKVALLETSGDITVLKQGDVSFKLPVIIDGKISYNKKIVNINKEWLQKKLQDKGVDKSQILLATIDENKELKIYKRNDDINKIGFYNQFASYYDDVFPLSVEKLNFLSNKFTDTGGNKVLDIGTATGSYAIALAEEGYHVSAVDLDQQMIKLARLRIVNSNLEVDFKVADMLKLDKFYSENSFNGIYCIGNVLVHLDTKKDIKKALGIMAKLLKPEGIVIIQIINYQRILKNNVTRLPVIINENKGITFSRRYLLEDSKEKIRFITNLSIGKGEKNTYQNTIMLLPLLPDELLDALGEIGFRDVRLYGGFSGECFNEQVVPCIAVGRL